MAEEDRRTQALAEYRKKLLAHKEVDSKVRSLREQVKGVKKEYDKTEDDLKALQSVGQIIGEVLRQLDEERCEHQWCRFPSLDCADECDIPKTVCIWSMQILSRLAAALAMSWGAGAKLTKPS